MDAVLLVFVNKFLKYSATYFRIFIAATIGAAWSCIAMTVPIHNLVVKNICTYILVSFIMIRICANKSSIKDIMKGVVALYVVAFVIGGGCHMLYYYTKAGYYINTVILNDRLLMFAIFLSVILLISIAGYLNRYFVYDTKLYNVRINIGEQHVDVKAILDTGNVLQDPIYHKPVNVIEYEAVKNIFKIDDCTKVKYHMIPFHSLGCECGCIEVIMVDDMYIYRDGKTIVRNKALMGMYKQQLSGDHAYQMLLNSEMFN